MRGPSTTLARLAPPPPSLATRAPSNSVVSDTLACRQSSVVVSSGIVVGISARTGEGMRAQECLKTRESSSRSFMCNARVHCALGRAQLSITTRAGRRLRPPPLNVSVSLLRECATRSHQLLVRANERRYAWSQIAARVNLRTTVSVATKTPSCERVRGELVPRGHRPNCTPWRT